MALLQDKLKQELYKLLDDKNKNENDIQKFLETHTELIPLPYLENHWLHLTSIISKFKLGNEYITDFAYLTKNSGLWTLVLIEIEDSKKRIFQKNKTQPSVTSDFTAAFTQIMRWKSYVESNMGSVENSISKLKCPLPDNPIQFKYILIIGRSSEKRGNEKRIQLFNQYSRDNCIIMTYDSLIEGLESGGNITQKVILSSQGGKGFKIKSFPSNDDFCPIFANISSEFLAVGRPKIEQLKKLGYDMDLWLNGQLLRESNRYPLDES